MSDNLILQGKFYEKPSPGLHVAMTSLVEDLGVRNSKYGPQHQIIIIWELDETMREGDNAGKNFTFSQFYPAEITNRNKTGKLLAGYAGKKLSKEQLEKGINISKLQGKPCQLNLIEDEEKDRMVIDSVLPLPPQMAEQAPERTITEPPEWVQKFKENSQTNNVKTDEPDTDDSELPF